MFKADLEDFFIVTVVSNTARYHRRYFLYEQFKKMVAEAGVQMITVELAFGHRPFEITKACDPCALQLRSHEEFWHKENMINLGIAHGRRLWPHKKNVGWVDADCAPVGKTPHQWFTEVWHELQHFEFVQMWEWMQPLDYDHNPLGGPNPSFMSNYVKYDSPYPKKSSGYPHQWGSPGLAWAENLDAIDEIGGIPDAAVLGAGDWYLAHMLISNLNIPDMHRYTKGYRDYWIHRQNLCEKWIRRDVGFVKTFLLHYYHGKIVNRGYNTRENILIDGQFDPNIDLKRDHQGLWKIERFEPRQIRMYDRMRLYFRARSEDSID